MLAEIIAGGFGNGLGGQNAHSLRWFCVAFPAAIFSLIGVDQTRGGDFVAIVGDAGGDECHLQGGLSWVAGISVWILLK